MSYKDFEQGIPSSRLQEWKEQEARELLRQEMTSRWQESERILGILRSTGSVTDSTEAVEAWFNGVKKYPQAGAIPEQIGFWTPSTWFGSRFPEITVRFGRAFFEETVAAFNGKSVVKPSVINEDFFAAMLGGEKRLGHKMVYLPGEGFLYQDPKMNAFASTSDQKVEILLSNYLIKCAEDMGRNVDSKLLVNEHRRPSVLAGIVKRARTVLEADPRFFQGINGARRVANGKTIQPAILSSPEDFIHTAFTRSEGSSVVVGEAFQEFLRFCQMGNLTRVEFTEFKRVAKELILEKFQLGLRHDIRTPEGRQTHGWKHLCLLPNPSLLASEAA